MLWTYLCITFIFLGHTSTLSRELFYSLYSSVQMEQSIYLINNTPYLLLTHIISGIIWIGLGIIQVSCYRRYIHKYIGYIYTTSCMICSSSSPFIAHEFNGDIRLVLGSFLWFIISIFTLMLGIVNIRNKNINGHRKWMLINIGAGMGSVLMRPVLLMYKLFLISINLDYIHQSYEEYNNMFFYIACVSFSCTLFIFYLNGDM